jgi:cell pole-organizing protein PopZ
MIESVKMTFQTLRNLAMLLSSLQIKEKMTKVAPLYIRVRKFLLLVSKIVFIFASTYYLANNKFFSLLFSLPSSIRNMPVIGQMINIIETIGVYTLIGPMAIVIVSFFYKSTLLQIVANFFAVSGNLFTLIHGLNTGLLQDKFQVGFMAIYNKFTFETKINTFKSHLSHDLQSYVGKDSVEFGEFAQNYINESFGEMTRKLVSMNMEQVRNFSKEIVINIHNSYKASLEVVMDKVLSDERGWGQMLMDVAMSTVKVTLMIVIGAAIIGGVLFLGKKFKELGEMTRDTAKTTEDIAEVVKKEITNNMVIGKVAEANARVSNEMAKGIKLLTESTQDLLVKVKNNDSITDERIKKIEEHLGKLGNGAAGFGDNLKQFKIELENCLSLVEFNTKNGNIMRGNLEYLKLQMEHLQNIGIKPQTFEEFMTEKGFDPSRFTNTAALTELKQDLEQHQNQLFGRLTTQVQNCQAGMSEIGKTKEEVILYAKKSKETLAEVQGSIKQNLENVQTEGKRAVAQAMSKQNEKMQKIADNNELLLKGQGEITAATNDLADKLKETTLKMDDLTQTHVDFMEGQEKKIDNILKSVGTTVDVKIHAETKVLNERVEKLSVNLNERVETLSVDVKNLKTELDVVKTDVTNFREEMTKQFENLRATIPGAVKFVKGVSSDNQKIKAGIFSQSTDNPPIREHKPSIIAGNQPIDDMLKSRFSKRNG